MNEIGSGPLEPTAQVAEQVSTEGPRDRRSRPRRQPIVPSDPNSEPADRSETTPHRVDSLV
jgi:hypothetical protein